MCMHICAAGVSDTGRLVHPAVLKLGAHKKESLHRWESNHVAVGVKRLVIKGSPILLAHKSQTPSSMAW